MSEQFDFLSLEQPLRAEWPVTVNEPQPDGSVISKTFKAVFELVSQEDVLAIVSDPKLDRYSLLRRQWVGFGKAHTGPPFSDEILIRAAGRPYMVEGIAAAYRDFASGIAVKN